MIFYTWWYCLSASKDEKNNASQNAPAAAKPTILGYVGFLISYLTSKKALWLYAKHMVNIVWHFAEQYERLIMHSILIYRNVIYSFPDAVFQKRVHGGNKNGNNVDIISIKPNIMRIFMKLKT